MKLNSKIKFFMQNSLSSSDFKVLSLLYQPLVGYLPYSIYSTFYHLIGTNKTYSLQTILDIFNIKKEEFTKSREKLEAVSLLETYQNNNEFIIVLKSPFTAKQFLIETFLGAYLESEIGEKNFSFLIDIFKVNKPKYEEYTNITKQFDDLYEFSSKKTVMVDFDLEGKHGVNTKLIDSDFAYDDFIEKLPRPFKSPDLLNNNYKNKVKQLAYVYQFTIEDMITIFENANKGNNHANFAQINHHARLLYENKNKELLIVEKKADEDDVISNLNFQQIVEKFAAENPAVKASALATIYEFISQNDIDKGVLNVLLIVILKNKNGVLPNVNYLNKVWQTWSKNGINSVSSAMKYKEDYENRTESSNNSFKGKQDNRRVIKPDWLDQYIKEIEDMEG